MTDEEYDQGLIDAGYDPAHDDPNDRSFYCRHGRYIGSPGGPDYMCGYCESGDEPPTDAELAVMRVNKMLKIEGEFDKAVQVCQGLVTNGSMNFSGALAGALCGMADTSYFSQARGLYIYA